MDLRTEKQKMLAGDLYLASDPELARRVTIGDNATIGAESVVTRDIPPNVLAAGNPFRVIRPLGEGETRS